MTTPTNLAANVSSQQREVAGDPPAVELRAAGKSYFDSERGLCVALRGISLSFAAGRIAVILGENGAGKSTLLRLIAGLAAPSSGQVLVFGSAERDAWKPRLGYMPHASLLYEELSGLENLLYFARLYELQNNIGACRNAMLAVGLEPSLTRRASHYSQGMRQRLSLARAVVHNPDLLLLDEPFSNVDAASAALIAQSLAGMRSAGKTVLLVTHQPEILGGIADEVILLSQGALADRRSCERSQPAATL